MKIGVLTLHRVKNYGSVLQTYAVSEVLKKKGHDVEIIDYIPERMKPLPDLVYVREDRYTTNDGKKNLPKKYILILASVLPRAYYYNKFRSFIARRVKTTKKKFYTFESLCHANFNYDVYMNGSDQIWNMDWENDIDKSYLLGFAPENKTKGSFAASFGKAQLTERESSVMGEYLRKYTYISVRESSGIDILKKMGINNAVHIVDPTLVLTKEDWKKIASRRLVKKNYLLIYQLRPDSELIKYARKIADAYNLIVVDFCRKIKCDQGVDKVLAFGRPEDFLSAIMYAEFIVTDSFHCTAFSINFNKKFLSLNHYYPERQRSLLEKMGLLNRFIPKNADISVELLMEPVNYEDVNQRLHEERRKAHAFLDKMLKG